MTSTESIECSWLRVEYLSMSYHNENIEKVEMGMYSNNNTTKKKLRFAQFPILMLSNANKIWEIKSIVTTKCSQQILQANEQQRAKKTKTENLTKVSW